jgi:ActR/RegA family two-component response regulator
MTSALLIDDDAAHAERVGIMLAQRGLVVTRVADIGEAIKWLQVRARAWEIVVLVFGDRSRPWLAVLRELQEAGRQAGFLEVPQFLCVSRLHLGVEVQLQIERMGARYACEE